ncbi:MAG: DegT/DnrJ/EryC1/StrS family aminotransferase [Candidatus Binatia bacterium]|nr:DegT/DnrJ/EryC1/StrS family aminotransferase [Candidatus Binatia bacterium]
MQIPFFPYPHVFTEHRDDVEAAMNRCLERGAFILQDELEEFERAVGNLAGVAHVVGVANGTDSLMLALRVANVGSGDEVIMASHTYVATAAAAHFVGAKPVLVECREDRLIDPEAVEAAVTDRTRVLMPTQLNGRIADMDALQAIADRHGLVIIEDAAQALGATYRGKSAGTFGLAGSISLYPAKLLGSFGDGGLLLTDSADVARKLRMLRDHGRDDEGEVQMWGVNSRLDNLQAAVLLPKLRHYSETIARRREIAAIYDAGLRGLEQIGVPPGPNSDPDRMDVYQNYEIEADRRDELRAHLRERGVGSIIQWGGKPLHRLNGLGLASDALPYTDRFFERCMLLPMNTALTDEELSYIIEQIGSFYG